MLLSEPRFVQIAAAMESGVRIELGATPFNDSLARAYHGSEMIFECKGPYADLEEVLTELDNLLYDWNEGSMTDHHDL